MDDEVVIRVRADDDVDAGFNSARSKAKKLGDDIEGDVRKSGPKIGSSLGGGMLSGLQGTLPSFGQFGGAIGVILAPTIGAAVSAGIIGGAGGLGIVGGLAIAAKDPAVGAAGKALADEVGGDLKEAASSFIPVAIGAIGKVRSAWKDVLPDVRSIFERSSGLVDPLLDGALNGVKRVISGINTALEGARPVFESFGNLAAEVGGAVQRLFEGVADDGDAAAAAVDDITMALTNTIDIVGAAVNALTELKGKMEDLDSGIDSTRYKLEDGVSWLDLTADGYKKGSEAAEMYRQGLIGAAGSANDYNHYLEEQKKASDGATASTKKQTSALKDLSEEMQAQTDPLFGLIDAQRDVTQAQDKYNDALRKHGPRSDEAREAMADLGQAAFALNGKVGAAAGGFDGRLTPAMRTALRNAGLTAGQMDRLEGQLRSAAKAANAWEGTFTQTYITRRIITGPGGQKLSAGGGGRQAAMAHGGISGAENGATSSGMTLVGEHGPELLDLPPGTSVQSNPDTMRALGGGGGAGDMRVWFDMSRATGLMGAIMEGLRAEIHHQGGNVQQVLGVPGAA